MAKELEVLIVGESCQDISIKPSPDITISKGSIQIGQTLTLHTIEQIIEPGGKYTYRYDLNDAFGSLGFRIENTQRAGGSGVHSIRAFRDISLCDLSDKPVAEGLLFVNNNGDFVSKIDNFSIILKKDEVKKYGKIIYTLKPLCMADKNLQIEELEQKVQYLVDRL